VLIPKVLIPFLLKLVLSAKPTTHFLHKIDSLPPYDGKFRPPEDLKAPKPQKLSNNEQITAIRILNEIPKEQRTRFTRAMKKAPTNNVEA
jgi:hypothetical protein